MSWAVLIWVIILASIHYIYLRTADEFVDMTNVTFMLGCLDLFTLGTIIFLILE